MVIHSGRPLAAGDRLPILELRSAPHGRIEKFRQRSPDALVLLLLPEDGPASRVTVEALADRAEAIEHWYAHILVVAGPPEHAAEIASHTRGKLTVIADPDRATFERIGIAAGNAALVIADRYGQIYELAEATAATEIPSTDEIEEWTKFLATQCPECGVIDEPGYGEWALT
jgi:hypothetical protein